MLVEKFDLVGAGVASAWRTGLAPGVSPAPMTLPAAAKFTAPASDATGVDGATAFGWTRFEGGVHLVEFSGTTVEPNRFVVTAEAQARIPDFSWAGAALAFRSGARYQGTLHGIGPCASIDDAAGPNLLLRALYDAHTAPPFDGYSSHDSVPFTTK